MAYFNEDDDKKKSSSSSSSGSSKGSSTKSSSSGGSSKSSSGFSDPVWSYQAQRRTDSVKPNESLLDTKQAALRAVNKRNNDLLANGATLDTGLGPLYRRGDRNYNRAQQSYYNKRRNQTQQQQQPTSPLQPQNATQGLAQSNATQYGIRGISGLNNTTPDLMSDGKWYAGEAPTDIEAAARIQLRGLGDDTMDELLASRRDKGSSFYRAYSGITSEAVGQLAALGVEIPAGGLTDEWFQKNQWLMQYYKPSKNSTTGNPTYPKHGTLEQKAAFWYYQAQQDRDDTNKAETELAALKEELAFYAGSNGNYSDEEIAGKVDWKKYPTLVKMGSIKGSEDGTPLQFVRRIDFDQDYLQGMIWAARNGGGSGDAFSDSVYALLGEGAGYQDNPEIRAKRTWTRDNKDYSPYSLGPSSAKMNEAGMYFGTYSFDKEWLDQNAERYVNSLNPKDQEMINRVLEADKFTSNCEAELDELLNGTIGEDGTRVGGLDSAVADFSYSDDKSFEENVDALLEEVYGDRNFKNLEKLDESMADGPLGLRDTTRAIDYRKQDIRALLAEKLQAKQTAPTVKDAGDETETWFERAWRGLQSAFTPEPTPDPADLVQIKGEAGNAVEDTRQKTAASVGKTVNDIGTPSEKNQWRTGEIGQQETSDKIGGNIKKGIPTGTGGQVMLDLIDGSVDGTDYINNRNTILQYEDNNERLKGIREERDQILNRRNERKGGYINRNDEIAANFGQNSTKSASLFGWVFGNNEQPVEDEEEVEAVEQEYRPAVADMTLDQKTAWIQRKINNVNTTDEEAAGLRDLLAQYRASANWDDNDEAVPMQRQMLDDALAQYIGEPAYAPQNTGIDPEIARLQQEAMDAVSKLNPDVETFEEAQAWVAEQEGDSEDLADAKDAVRLVELAGEERVLNVRQEEMQADYDKAFDMIKGLRNRYAEDQTVWTVTGSGGETNLIAADVLDFVSQFGDYVPYQYSDTNYYDYLIKDKGYSAEQAREEAVKNNDSYRELKNYIQTALDACDEKGVSIPAEYRQHMEQEMTRLDKLIADGTYYALRGNDDFVAVTDAAAKPKSDDEPGFVSPQSRPAGFTDMEWNVVSTPGTDVAPAIVRNMTEDEQRTFLYLANSYEDKRLGAKAAQKYYEHLTDEYGAVTTRRGREMTEAMYNDFRNLDAVTFNVGGTLATIAMHPFQAMSGFYTFGMAMMGKTANPDSVWGALGKASNRERETIRGIAVDAIGSQFGETAGNLAGDGYDLVTGIFDNLWDAAVMGATGFSGPLGEAGEAASFGKKAVYNIVNGTVTAMPLGLSAAGMEYIDAIGRGLSPEQAYLLAGISGLAEAVTEGLEIESFTDAYGRAGKEGFKGLLQNIALSMTNESVGEALGQYAENIADDVISGHLSNRNQLFEQYVAAGYGKEEAHKLADHAMTMDIVKAAIMGGLSGGLSTALTGSAGAFHYESDYSTFRKTNADYLTNLVHGFQDIGFSPTAAQRMADQYAREAYDAHAEDIANTANNMQELRAERRSVNLTAIEAENAANENAQRLQEADMAADEFAEEQGEPFTPYTPAERPVNPRMEEVNNFEITPLTQFNELTDELAKIDGTETFSGEVKSEAVETLYSAVGYTDMAQEAAANGDTQTADDYLRKGMAAFNALDAILDRAGIDKGRFPFLTDTEAMAQVREYMNRQGPEQQFKQTGGEQTTLIPGESETAPIVDNEGLTAEDARAEKVDTRPVEMQGGQVTNITGESETSPDINTAEAMETVNRGPEPLRPIQGPTIRKNPFSAEFKRELASRDQMKGQVLTLSGKQATPANGATMLAGVFDSVVAMKDSITDGQAMAAAKRLLGKAKDVDSVIGAVRSILVTAADQSINNTDTVNAIQTAALTDGEAGRILDNIINIGTATPNRVRNLVATAMREAGTLANEMWANTYDGMVAEIVHRMAGEGALTRTSKAQAEERARYSQLKEAQKTTETQEEVIAALQQKLTNAYDTFKATPLDKIAEAAFNSAQKQLDAAFSVLMSYRKSETNARNAHSQARQNYFDTRNEEMTQVREAAKQEADQRIAEARAQRQEREAQRQASGNAVIVRNIESQSDPNQTRLDGRGAMDASQLESVMHGSFNQTAQDLSDEANGIAKGQVQFSRVSAQQIQQRDTEYQQAVESGDTETAQRMVDDLAESAMRNSKIRDEDGKLLMVYHGTDQKFTVFDSTKSRANMDIQGLFFSPWELDAEGYGPNVGRYFLDIKNPASESEGYKALRKFQGQNGAGAKAREYLISKGYDGVNNGDEEFIAFYPEQIKSADAFTRDNNGNVIPLSQRFNQRNPDIRYARVGSQAQAQANRQARQGKPARSPEQISKDLMNKLGVGDYVPTNKDIPKGVLGYFRERANYIAVTPKEAGNFTTTMHEIGHAVASRLGITGTQQMVNNLPAAFHNAYSQAELPGEAFAEFMWRYMENDQGARQFAGDAFVDDFERRLDDAGIADDVHEAANQIRQFLNADAFNKIGAVVRDASDTQRKPIREWFRSIIARNIDASSAAENLNSRIRKETGNSKVDFSVDVRQNARMENSAEKRAGFILTKGMMDANWTRTGEDGLAQVFEKNNITTKDDIDMLSRYMLAKHSFDRDAQGKPVFSPTITEAERRAFIDDVEANRPNIVSAAEGFQTFRHNVMKHLMVDTGFLGPNGEALLAAWEQMYPNYVPTYRFRGGESDTMGKSGYQVMSAKGSTEDIINPIESFANIVKKIVTQVSRNNTALAMHNAYQTVGNLGEFMREVTPDQKKVSVDTRSLQKTVEGMLNGQVSAQTLQDVLDAIGETQEQWVVENGTKVQNAVTVQLPDGSKRYYQVQDQELYNLLAAVPPAQIQGLAQTIGRATRGMTAVTTGSNPLFAFRNAMRDFQNSVNYGSWAATYLDGAVKWMKAFYDVWTGSNDFKDYEALGGGGWMRINPTQKKSARELRNELIPGYENGTVKGAASKALNKVSALVTLEKLNEVIEQTSRFAEYRYGKHDLNTAEGRQEAYLAGQDVTVDFGRRGYGSEMNVIKQVIPFFSAATQGVYRTGRMLTESERSRALPRFAKTVFNTALTSALAAGIMLKFGDDDEKFAFENMSDDLKSNHVFFPNIAPHVFGNRPLIRIPLAQDPLTYAVHGFMTNAAWYGTSDQDVIDVMAIANTILDNLNPASGGPIWSAISDVQKNKTWFGSKIIPTRLEDLNTNPSAQYTADTPDMFVAAGRALNVSPLNLQYLAEQYTGFVGQLLIPALSKDKHTGELGGWNAAIASAQNRFTTDPLISNEAVGAFYDGADMLSDIVTTVKDGQPLNQLRRGISQGEANRAYTEAEKLTGKDGLVAKTKSKVTAWYAEIDKINASTSLSDESKYEATSAIRLKMVKECLKTNEQIEKYREKYVTGIDFATASLWQALLGQNPTVKQNKKKK